ncbi:MAG: SusC/RagA family TonB-linked outer membrane protein [Niabella sp.]
MTFSEVHAQIIEGTTRSVDTSAADPELLKTGDNISKSNTIRANEELGMSGVLDNRVFLWYNNIKNKNKAVSANTIYGNDLSTIPLRDASNMLAGRLSGLYTTQSTGLKGSDDASLILRGRSPLIVVDGVVRSFLNMNPNDIKAVTVLKDATATAMWGLRGANGVLLVETKSEGIKNFTLHAGVQYGASEPLTRPKFLNAYNYGTLYNEALLNDNADATPAFSDSLLNVYRDGTNNHYLSPDVAWYDQVFKDKSLLSRLNLDVSGSGKSYRYYASLEKFSQGADIVKDPANAYNTTNYYNRYNIRLNAAIDFNDDITLGLNLFGSLVKAGQPGYGLSNIMTSIYATPPTAYPVRNEDGSFAGTTLWRNNILASTISSGYLQNNERTISEDIFLKYKLDKLIKGLWVKGGVSINNYYYATVTRSKSYAVYQYVPGTDGAEATYTQYGSNTYVTVGSETTSKPYSQVYYNFIGGYDKAWANSDLNVLTTYNIDGATYNSSLSSLDTKYKTFGLDAKYSYLNKYLLHFSGAYSGMNYYPPGKEWGLFPSFSAGWVVSNERFWKESFVSFLKIRSSIGKSAWGNPGYYSWIRGFVSGDAYNIGTTSTSVSSIKENTVPNSDITWEKSMKWDIGAELGLFNNALYAEINFYKNHNYDQLITVTDQSSIFGGSYPDLNRGITNYSGIETLLKYSAKINKVIFNASGNIAFAKSKVIDIGEGDYPYNWMYLKGNTSDQIVGYEAIGFYSALDDYDNIPHLTGYTPQAGDLKYKDLNDDGVINYLDKKPLYPNVANIFYGLNFSIRYWGLDFSALLQGALNRNVYLTPTSYVMSAFYNGYGTVQESHLQRWTPENPDALYPRLSLSTNANNTASSSFWVKNGNYLRLKNIEMGYSIPKSILKRAHLSELRLFINAVNILTFSKLKDYNVDPEAPLSLFPIQKTLNMGISLKL